MSRSRLTPIQQYNPYKFRVHQASASTVGPGFTLITFDTKDFDTSSNYSTSTHLFTAPVPGFYWFHAQVKIHTGSSTNNVNTVFFKNGSIYENSPDINSNSGYTGMAIGDFIQLSANDTIGVYAQAPNGSVSTQVDSPTALFFAGFLVSAT